MASVPTSSHGSSGAAGDETLLSTTTLGADGVFDVTGISGAYNDLRLVLVARGTRAAVNDFLQMRLNNDSGANYDSAWSINTVGTNSLGATSARMSGQWPAASALANGFALSEIFIPLYAGTAKLKVVRFTNTDPGSSAGTTPFQESGAVLWNSTAAITRVGFFGGTTANLLAGSQLRIYGVT